MEARPDIFEKLTDLVLAPNALPGRPSRASVEGLVKTCLEMCAVELTEVSSPVLFNERSNAAWLVYTGGCRPWDRLES